MSTFRQRIRRGWLRWALAIALAAQAVCLWALLATPRLPAWLVVPVAAIGMISLGSAYLMCLLERDSDQKGVESNVPAPLLKPVEPPAAKRILLAEDSEDNQALISTFLRQAGWEVVIACDGAEAVRLATAQRFDLVLMDVQMPEMDGYQATRALRRSGFTRPIVALTADTGVETPGLCLAAGCTQYLTKPVDRRKLLAACYAHLHPTPGQPVASAAPGKPLRSALAADPRLARVLEGFVSRLPQRVKQLSQSAQSANLDALRQAVHNLKGAGAGYGFESLSQSAEKVEQAIRENSSLEQVRGQVQELIGLIERIEGYDAGAGAVTSASA